MSATMINMRDGCTASASVPPLPPADCSELGGCQKLIFFLLISATLRLDSGSGAATTTFLFEVATRERDGERNKPERKQQLFTK